MRRLAVGVVALAFVGLPAIARAAPPPRAPHSCAQTFCAGAGRGDITPPVTTPMWGYTARQLLFHASEGDLGHDAWIDDKTSGDVEGYCKTFECNQGVQSRLYANAFVLRDRHGTKLALVQVDLGGLPAEVHQAVADRLASRGLDRSHLLISATHTHQGPGGIFQYQGYAILGGDEFDPRVFDAVVSGIVAAVDRADDTLTPARLAWGQTDLDGANSNRRLSNQWCLNPEVSCQKGTWTGAGPPPNNRTLTVIRVDARDGQPIGAITNFGNHGTVGGDKNLLFSGDNQAYAVRDVERGIAAACPARGCKAGWPVDALLNGAQGDQSPNGDAGSGWNGLGGVRQNYAAMEGAGQRQAPATLALWSSLGRRLTDRVDLDARFEFLCFCGQQVSRPGPNYDGDPAWDHVSAFAALGRGGITDADGTSSPAVVPTQGKKAIAAGGVGIAPDVTRLQALRIGDLLVATVPGEPTVQVGRRLIQRALAAGGSRFRGAIVAALGDDYDSYFTTPEEYRSYAYEASFSLFGPQAGELLIEEQEKLAAALSHDKAVAACSASTSCVVPPPNADVAVPPTPTAPDVAAGTVVAQPAPAIGRFQTATFTWVGGSPSAEWAPDADRVRIEQLVNGQWVPVAGDARATQTLLEYAKANGQHQWKAEWEAVRDAAPGTYRFHVFGSASGGPGQRAPYSVASAPFDVAPSQALTATASGSTIHVAYPKPDPNTSFRMRPAAPDGGTAYGVVNGACASSPVGADGTATFAGPVQQSRGGRDQFGNQTPTAGC